jgi:serine/threonine protein kinase
MQFGKFELLEHIGEGGMAEVFLARPSDASLSKLIALKRILPALANNPYFEDMFRREGEIALRFRHPSIVTVYEIGQVQNASYMTMEYLPGKTLAELIRKLQNNKDAMDTASKVSIIKCVADALQYIHDFADYGELTEIIHRDISPHNILIGFDGATKLIDFGIAKLTSGVEVTGSQNLKGKVAYMSPEQVKGLKLTKQTDIFSLGIVLWEILAGKKLFTGKSVGEVSAKVETCEVPPLVEFAPDVPMELRTVCRIALAKETGDRYSSAGEMAADLDNVLRKYYRNRKQKQLSVFLHELFPADVLHLQAVLKKHEITRRELPAHSEIFEQKTSPAVLLNRTSQSPREHSTHSLPTNAKSNATNTIGAQRGVDSVITLTNLLAASFLFLCSWWTYAHLVHRHGPKLLRRPAHIAAPLGSRKPSPSAPVTERAKRK